MILAKKNLRFLGHVNGVNVIGLSLQGPSVPIAAIRPPSGNLQGIQKFHF